jgi:hypothetical protein
MAPAEPKISKRGAARKIWGITLTIPEKLQIIRKSGSAKSPSIIMTAYDTQFLTNYGIKKHMKKITCKNSDQQRYRLTNGIFNNPAPLQSCGCQIK